MTQEQLAPIVRAGQTFEVLGWGGFLLAAGTGATALMMFLFGAPPSPISLTVSPSSAGLAWGGSW